MHISFSYIRIKVEFIYNQSIKYLYYVTGCHDILDDLISGSILFGRAHARFCPNLGIKQCPTITILRIHIRTSYGLVTRKCVVNFFLKWVSVLYMTHHPELAPRPRARWIVSTCVATRFHIVSCFEKTETTHTHTCACTGSSWIALTGKHTFFHRSL